MNPDDFFRAPYGDRQLVAFVDDSKAEQLPMESLDQDGTRGRRLALLVGGTGASALSFGLGMLGIAASSALIAPAAIGVVAIALTTAVLAQEGKSKQSGILLIRKSWAPRFNLPPGHPRVGVVFAGHPADPSKYIPIADFHRYIFEHRFSEVLSLLMHLGADNIEVEHVRGWGKDFSAKLSVGIPSVSGSQEAAASKSHGASLLYKAELPGHSDPTIPEDLVWYHHESTWKQVVEGRMKFGLRNFSLNLQYQEDYGINTALKGKVKRIGLELGGDFEHHQSTTWEIRGSFKV
jgi:hypothetical protein